MSKNCKREELYNLVWARPLSKVATDFGVSDFALSKTCKKHGIPHPPRGYWAKLASDKAVSKTPLPQRGLGMPQEIDLERKEHWFYSRPTCPAEVVIPPPVEFQESQEALEKRVKKMVGKITVTKELEKTHYSIRNLLEKDNERIALRNRKHHLSSLDAPLFQSPYERRRLQLLNAIFIGLECAGVKVSLRGNDPHQFGFKIGEQQLSFSLDHPGIERHGWRWGDELNRPTSLPMQLDILWWKSPSDLELSWKDKPGKKLEEQLKEIVVCMIVAGEMHYRLATSERRVRLVKLKSQLIEEAKRKIEEDEQRIVQENYQREQATIDRLMGEAEAFHRAQVIREYAFAVRAANKSGECPFSEPELDF